MPFFFFKIHWILFVLSVCAWLQGHPLKPGAWASYWGHTRKTGPPVASGSSAGGGALWALLSVLECWLVLYRQPLWVVLTNAVQCRVCERLCACVRTFWSWFFSFYHVGPSDRTQVIRLSSKRFYPPSFKNFLLAPYPLFWPYITSQLKPS